MHNTGGALRRVWSLVVAIFLFAPGAYAAAQVLDTAVGSHQVGVLHLAAATFLVWCSLPVVFLYRGRLERCARNAPLVLALLAIVGSTAFTLWVVRPQAPDGRGFEHTYDSAVVQLEDELGDALEEAVPGRWAKLDVDHGPIACVDQFGRDRGAGRGGPSYEIDGVLSDREVRVVEDALAASDRVIVVGREDGAVDDRYVIHVNSDRASDRSALGVTTPCLRTDSDAVAE